MGIVIKQSFKNTVSTYLGFGIGAINTLFLYTNFISDEYYGLVGFILSAANIMMPLMAFGVQNTMIKFYSTYKTKNSINSFLTLMLFLPLAMAIPIGGIGFFAHDMISNWLGAENEIVKGYVWHIFITAVAMAYFEVFFAWAKVQMQTVFGNFMKEVFHRIAIMILLFAVYFNWFTVEQFINALVGVYVLRMVVMKLYAYSVRWPVIRFSKIENLSAILKYSSLIIIAGSIATLILDIDKFMLGKLRPDIEEVAYYSVAIFIATVIAVPQRAMHQILMPLTAKLLNDKNTVELRGLYQRSSLNLYVVSGLIFLLIVLNINELYLIIPKEFREGLLVVFLISAAKLYDNVMGNNNAILFNSDYYRMVLFFGVLLTILIVLLNLVFIPKYGMNGAAIATFIAIFIYNSIKIYFVKMKFGIWPFSKGTVQLSLLIVLLLPLFYVWDFPFHPILNICLKSFLIVLLYGLLVFKFRISQDIHELVEKRFKK
ncbi:lipopolysaccharide biosynthesis protein [Mangrovimonas sp. YM274]|uniref:lipopolysaccharide biosynthesis protein n=1 Tax=Mangrovimonas sp. YM274 TaxID=3070660 RepID=UPI0027DE1222|nr:polysaccharide biosynthesis C-terminal domain-containing protein [Mangrovimonas sp. YM274]WMI67214.1 polysaccharide biosynthesis C-terminal domain-containing protein [Mangrovimonas sp. YM274]